MSVMGNDAVGVAESPTHPEAHGTNARADVIGGLLWMALGIVIFVASWRMDRLEAQDINPYTVPGLVPGLLGLGMMFFAGLMLLRGWRDGGLRLSAAPGAGDVAAPDYARLAIVLALCVGYAVVLLGRTPFWLASWLYVTLSITVLRYGELKAKGMLARGLLSAALIGLGAGVLVSLVFERIFLVRLP